MTQTLRGPQKRENALSRDRIVDASISLLDSGGEEGLTFRALSELLSTGPGAIYGHIANRNDLLTAACDAIVARTLAACAVGSTPDAIIQAVALALFDMIDEHPWTGSALTRAGGQLPIVRIVERLGQQVRALGVPEERQWVTVSALLNYIRGVGVQNAANTQMARTDGLDRATFLDAVATLWSQLDGDEYAFVRSFAGQLRDHDDRADFLAGIDLILRGIGSSSTRDT